MKKAAMPPRTQTLEIYESIDWDKFKAATSLPAPVSDQMPISIFRDRLKMFLSEMAGKRPSDDDFEVLHVLGTGAFSTVYLARSKQTGRLYALKRLIWTLRPDRVLKEIQWMVRLSHPHVVKILSFYRVSEQVTLVLEYIPHSPFRDILLTLTPSQVKIYMSQLLSSLVHIHKCGVIHRDIKPSNFLFDPSTNRGCTIDCGLCEEDLSVAPIKPVADDELKGLGPPPYELKYPHLCQKRPMMLGNRGGTRGFRAPEVLMAAWNQSSKIDVWSAGVILLSLLTRRYPFFKAGDDVVSLCEIATVVGSARLELAAVECLRRVQFPRVYREQNLRKLIIALNPKILAEDWDTAVYDLLRKMLEPVPSRRLSSAEALEHPFFRAPGDGAVLAKSPTPATNVKVSSDVVDDN
jgi:cell division control protein 7